MAQNVQDMSSESLFFMTMRKANNKQYEDMLCGKRCVAAC